jgi:signal transduction histidine kinase
VDGARLRLLELAPTATLKELLTATLDLAEELTGSQIGFFHFVEDDQSTLTLQAWSTRTLAGMCTAEGAGSHYPIDRAGIWADCVRTGKPVVHDDYASMPGKKGMPPGHAQVVRELTVPVVRSGRACAVLGVGNKPFAYDDADVADVSALADLAWDVAARKRAEEALHLSELQYRTLAHHFPRGVVGLFDDGLRMVLVDGSSPVLNTDPGSLLGKLPSEFAPPEVAGRMEEAFRKALSGTPAQFTIHVRDRTVDVSTYPVRDEQGTVIEGMIMTEDVTEQVALRSRLALTSRLAAMGTLVAGVAHEVNNPLAAELADQGIALEITRELRERLRGNEPIDRAVEARLLGDAIEALEEAQEAGQRISLIVKNLSTFGRPDPRRNRVRLGEVVAQAMRWLPATLARAAKVQVEDGGAPEVVASFGQLEQVVVNLVTNAAEAIPAGRRGLVVVRMGPGAPGMSRLEVIDDGKGIDPAFLERIFEPFFTTRPSGDGRGTGLGLAICHAIVTSHGGTLTVTSAPGRGSTFRMELPAAPPEA